jgi:hypothetical protein
MLCELEPGRCKSLAVSAPRSVVHHQGIIVRVLGNFIVS